MQDASELRRALAAHLDYYRDLGIAGISRDPVWTARRVQAARIAAASPAVVDSPVAPSVEASVESSVEPIVLSSADPIATVPDDMPRARDTRIILKEIRTDIGDCTRCKLHKGRTKLVFGTGNPETKLVFVGEGPGADEDAQGVPFVGRAGQLLTQMIEGTASKEGIPIQRPDVYICNVVKCRPPENRTPEPDEMQTCGQFLFRQLMAIQPRAICALGSTAAKALLGTKDGVTKLRGKWHKWNGIPLMVTYHPSYLLRAYNVAAKREAWEDLKKVLHYVYD